MVTTCWSSKLLTTWGEVILSYIIFFIGEFYECMSFTSAAVISVTDSSSNGVSIGVTVATTVVVYIHILFGTRFRHGSWYILYCAEKITNHKIKKRNGD